MDKTKVAIVGHGWVGEAMHKLFPKAMVYSPGLFMNGDFMSRSADEEVWEKEKPKFQAEVNECDIAFVCVPTPNIKEGELDTSIVEEVVSWLKTPLIVVRSTVNPGTCDSLSVKYEKRIVMQPEYLGETPNHPMIDPKTRQFLVIGGEPEDRRELINLYTTVYNANVTIRQVTNYEAEVIKLTENRAIAFKVAQSQELYDVCQKAGLDYYTIRDAVYSDDPRFNLWWTFVFPEKRGFNSKCIPKDVYAWCAWAESLGYAPVITRVILEKNKEWINSNEEDHANKK